MDESTIANQVRNEAAARSAQHRVRAHERRWRRLGQRLGLLALFLVLIIAAAQAGRVLPDHPALTPRTLFPLLLAYGVCCAIGGLWGGVFCLTVVFAGLAWNILGQGFDAWLWWLLGLLCSASVLLTFFRFGPRGGLATAFRRSPGKSAKMNRDQGWSRQRRPLPARS